MEAAEEAQAEKEHTENKKDLAFEHMETALKEKGDALRNLACLQQNVADSAQAYKQMEKLCTSAISTRDAAVHGFERLNHFAKAMEHCANFAVANARISVMP